MKISYRTHPALKFLEQGYLEGNIDPVLKARFKFNIDVFKKSIKWYSKSFIEAAKLSRPKLRQCVEDFWNDLPLIELTFLADNKCTFFLKANKNNEETLLLAFMGDNLMAYADQSHGKEYSWADPGYVLSTGGSVYESLEKLFFYLLSIVMFTKYASIETKSLAAGQKIKAVDCNYKNDTKFPVEIMNSTWFTNLVKSDAFKVRGHFRLQPKKINDQWTKELIWITDYEKHGYTAPARMLSSTII